MEKLSLSKFKHKNIHIELAISGTIPLMWSMKERLALEDNNINHFFNGYLPDDTRNSSGSYHSENYLIMENTITNGVECIGFFTITKEHLHRMATVAGLYIKKEKRRGFVFLQVCRFVANRVFNELNYRKIQADVWGSNETALKSYSKVMNKEGTRVGMYEFCGKPIDSVLFGISKKDFLKRFTL